MFKGSLSGLLEVFRSLIMQMASSSNDLSKQSVEPWIYAGRRTPIFNESGTSFLLKLIGIKITKDHN